MEYRLSQNILLVPHISSIKLKWMDFLIYLSVIAMSVTLNDYKGHGI